jgi:AraC-like DNA-binding protein
VRTIQMAYPRCELRGFVKAYAQREIMVPQGGLAQSHHATLEQGLGFYLDGQTFFDYPDGLSRPAPKVNVFGALTHLGGCHRFFGHILGFAIFLKPLALWQLFRIPASIMVNKDYDGAELLGNGILGLWSKLAETDTFSHRVSVIEEYLLPFAVNASAHTLIMQTAQHVSDCNGSARVDKLAYHATLSLRQYQRRFIEDVGITPKLFARTARFQAALDIKRMSPQRSWLGIAHELGYFDQMHMIRDFRILGGHPPAAVLEQSGDGQPWSIAGPEVLHELVEHPTPTRRHLFEAGDVSSLP